jgi:hypothetical protein
VIVAQLTFSETLQIELIKVFATAVLVAGAAALIVARYQSKSAATHAALEADREQAFKDRDTARMEAIKEREREIELERAKRQTKSQFVSQTSDLAGAFYFATQQYRRRKDSPDVWGEPDQDAIDSAYGEWARRSEILENELRVRYGWDSPPVLLWHQVRDLLTVRYFHLRDHASPRLREINSKDYEGSLHSGLTAAELDNPNTILDTYHSAMRQLAVSLTDSDVVV